MAEIPLTRGLVAIVDDADLPLVSDRKWHAVTSRTTVYAAHTTYPPPRRIESMHRVILGLGPRYPEVDHINGNGLDNRRENLRLAEHRQNMGNMRPRAGGSSRFKGVCRKQNGRWQAYITVNGKRLHLGYHADETAAAKAYDQAARAAFGEFARTNFEGEG